MPVTIFLYLPLGAYAKGEERMESKSIRRLKLEFCFEVDLELEINRPRALGLIRNSISSLQFISHSSCENGISFFSFSVKYLLREVGVKYEENAINK